MVNGKRFSIHIGEKVTCAHGCLIHGPCKLEKRVFIGFRAIVDNAVVGEGSSVSTNAVVTDGVRIASNRFVPPGALIDTQEKADALGPVPADRSYIHRWTTLDKVATCGKKASGVEKTLAIAARPRYSIDRDHNWSYKEQTFDQPR